MYVFTWGQLIFAYFGMFRAFGGVPMDDIIEGQISNLSAHNLLFILNYMQ